MANEKVLAAFLNVFLLWQVIVLLLCFYTKYSGVHSSGCQFLFWISTFITQGLLFWKAVEYIGITETVVCLQNFVARYKIYNTR